MNNSLGERADKTEEFKQKLEKKFDLPVILWDERLSTAGGRKHKYKYAYKKPKN